MPSTENSDATAPASDGDRTSNTQGWNWHPELPVENMPLFDAPANLSKLARWFVASWLTLSTRVIILGISIATWLWLQPALERCVTFQWGWISQMFVRNLAIMVLITGAVHLYFCTLKCQGKKLKFDSRDQAKDTKTFTFNDQVLDNMFWSLASGVTIWTAYEVLMMWAFANDYITFLHWNENPVLFLGLIFLTPIWNSLHFYWGHRLLHWRPLYLRVHALHHRNINVGPWAGMSMHPVEHVIYLSSVLIHFVVSSHPIHIFYNQQYQVLNAVFAHSGFENLLIKDKRRLRLGNFYHQLHHRYVDCNYGNTEMPWDKWFGSMHDGSVAGRKKIRERQRRLRPSASRAKA